MEEKIIYIPSDEDKKDAEKVCANFIDSLTDFHREKQAWILKILIEEFKELSGIDMNDVKID